MSDEPEALTWYDRLREQYRPERLEVLLVGESPPDPGDGERRFFYSPILSRFDWLYRGVAKALYGEDVNLADKPVVLGRIQDDGFWLIDAVDHPINKERDGVKRQAIRTARSTLSKRCGDLAPRRGVIICHTRVYEETASSLRAVGVPLLHDRRICFPIGNWQASFIADMRRALAPADWQQVQLNA